MAKSASETDSSSRDITFRSYTSEQGKAYAEFRRDYSPALYQYVIDHHTSTGGQLDTILDVGCGPGNVARALAPRFTRAIGIDPSEGMIAIARSLGGSSSAGPIRFEISTAEDLGSSLSPPVSDGSVDLVTAATAAHWFDMPAFWARAARILKPGGSVALWCRGDPNAHPSTPNVAAIQAAIDRFKDQIEDYAREGNRLASNLYAGLPLPWTVPGAPQTEFDESAFLRKEWKATDIAYRPEDNPFADGRKLDLDRVEKALGTMSQVTRWREAHPETVGTEDDIVRKLRREIERLLREAGVEEGNEVLEQGGSGVLLMVKKKA
ncbi:hypothetical protein VUR80DRAFT_2880 [Thermomyces stellatus]